MQSAYNADMISDFKARATCAASQRKLVRMCVCVCWRAEADGVACTSVCCAGVRVCVTFRRCASYALHGGVFARGQHFAPKQQVEPGELSIIAANKASISFNEFS